MAGQQQPTFRSEIYIPVRQDTQSFEQRQRSIWDDMNTRLTERRRLWETEVEQMRRDLFRLAPSDSHDLFAMPLVTPGSLLGGGSHFNEIFAGMTAKLAGGSHGPLVGGDHTLTSRSKTTEGREGHFTEPMRSGSLAEQLPTGHIDAEKKRFVLSFDVSNFKPEEISVRTDEHKLIVNARHTEHVDGRSINRQFSREVDIPRNVNPLAVQCTLSSDNILQIEAPLTLPSYDSVTTTQTSTTVPAAPAAVTSPPSATAPVAQQYLPQHSYDNKTSHHTTATVVTNSAPRFEANEKNTSGLAHSDDAGNRTYKISVDIGPDYKPEDISIKTVNRRLVVNARHEDKSPGKSSTREFSREFDVPEFIDPNTVTASMTDSGRLVLEAPLLHATSSILPTSRH